VGSLVGQRGVRVSTVMSELGGEKIDIIEWSAEPKRFIEDALSPAKVLEVEIDEENREAKVEVTEDQQSLAIGKGGQNVRLAAKLTGWKIDIQGIKGENLAEADPEKETVSLSESEKNNAKEENQGSEVKNGGPEISNEEVSEDKTSETDTPTLGTEEKK